MKTFLRLLLVTWTQTNDLDLNSGIKDLTQTLVDLDPNSSMKELTQTIVGDLDLNSGIEDLTQSLVSDLDSNLDSNTGDWTMTQA